MNLKIPDATIIQTARTIFDQPDKIGRLENAGSPYPVLTDVFFIVRQQDAQTKEIKNILVKRGSEWHAPDRMYINASHITIIEPVSPGSQVAKLTSEAKAQKSLRGSR